MRADDTLARNDQESALLLVKFFASVVLSHDLCPAPQIAIHVLHMLEITVTTQMVQARSKRLSVHNSDRPNRMHPQLLKSPALIIAGPLACPFTNTLEMYEILTD